MDGNSLQTSNRGQDLIINKFNYIGTTNLSRNVAWCTYFGGTDLDQAGGIAVSRVGDLYITGSTASFDFPVLTSDLGGNFNYLNLNQQSSGTNINMDAFILKLRNDGRLRHWCSYIGGNGWEDGWSVKVNGNEDIYIAGNTNSDGTSISPKFPLTTFTGGFNQSVYGGHGSQIHLGDGFLIKFSDADNVLWSTFFGGDEGERISDLALLDNDRIAIVGITESTVADNPSTGTPCVALNNGKFPDCDPGNGYYDASYNGGSTDGFFAIFNSSNQLEWSSYFGGSAADYIGANSISSTYSPSSKYFVTGHTGSQTTFPTTPHGSYNQVYAGGNTDVFIAEFDGYTRNWCTFFGGGSQDNAGSIAGDLYGRIFISGKTFSSSAVNTCSLTTNPTDFPICNSSGVLYSTNTFTGVGETFLAGFNSNHDLIWSSYFGGLEYSGLEQTKSLVTYQDRLYFAGYSTAPTATPVPQVEYATYYWQNGDKIGGVDCYIGFFDLDGLVGVEENEQLLRNSNIYLAPNPTDSKLNILLRLKKSSLNESSLTVKIISPTGIEVLSTPLVSTHEGNFTGTIDVSKIASGIYFVMVDIGDQIVSSKFIKHD